MHAVDEGVMARVSLQNRGGGREGGRTGDIQTKI